METRYRVQWNADKEMWQVMDGKAFVMSGTLADCYAFIMLDEAGLFK